MSPVTQAPPPPPPRALCRDRADNAGNSEHPRGLGKLLGPVRGKVAVLPRKYLVTAAAGLLSCCLSFRTTHRDLQHQRG